MCMRVLLGSLALTLLLLLSCSPVPPAAAARGDAVRQFDAG
jgi:hypothetical protein